MSTATTPNTAAKYVRLHFKCRGLADMDTFSKSDPYVVLYAPTSSTVSFAANQFQSRTVGVGVAAAPTDANKNKYAPANARVGAQSKYGRELGRTEIVMNNLNPVFQKYVDLQFLFETRQDLVAVVYDDDGHKADTKNDLCGFVNFQLSHVICSSQGRKEFPLTTGEGTQKGFIEISFSDISKNSRDSICLGFRGEGLVRGGFCSGSSPFFTLSRVHPNGSKTLLHTSEVISNSVNPRWERTPKIPMSSVAGSSNANDQTPSLLFELFSKGTFGNAPMGSFACSVADLTVANTSMVAFTPKKSNTANAKRYGNIFPEVVQIATFPTFTESLASGWQINMTLSIDFTGSNGDPSDRNSLHYYNRSSSTPNQYVSAMMSVGDILIEYDTDKQVPVFGFGAHFRSTGVTSHFFNVNMKEDPYVSGLQGALDAYGAFLPTVQLSGPTNFAPTILAVTAEARRQEAERVYTILLIITDGEITDMRETLDAVVAADDAPLSIVIVGVGNSCDFQMMVELDGDDTNLVASNGRVSRRDLVQFVPYRDFAPPKPREALAAEVLREIPDQFEEYLVLSQHRRELK